MNKMDLGQGAEDVGWNGGHPHGSWVTRFTDRRVWEEKSYVNGKLQED